jgi:hypothetical protein
MIMTKAWPSKADHDAARPYVLVVDEGAAGHKVASFATRKAADRANALQYANEGWVTTRKQYEATTNEEA